MTFEFTITKNIDIKNFLIENGFSLNIINNLLKNKKGIIINGKEYTNNYNLSPLDNVKIIVSEEKSNICCIEKPIDIIFEDEYFLVVYKEKGLVVIPSKLHYDDSLAGRVLFYYKSKNLDIGIHIINRLDMLTSGIVIFAKSKFVQNIMQKVNIKKQYLALVSGKLKNKSGIINEKIDRIANSIKRQVIDSGKECITEYNVIKESGENSLVNINLKTGRTHQIRVHFSYIGNPLVDDPLYNENKISSNGKKFYLSAYNISFIFPFNNKEYNFTLNKLDIEK